MAEEHVHCDDCGRELSPEEAKHEWGRCLCETCRDRRDKDAKEITAMPFMVQRDKK